MELKIDGRLIFPEDMTHEDAICRLMDCLSKRDIKFVGKTKDITEDKVKIYSK